MAEAQVFALSPSFPPQSGTITYMYKNNFVGNAHLPIIRTVYYFSNGTTLQATLWLNKTICCQHLNSRQDGMEISGIPGRFDTYIIKDNHGRWTSYLIEYELPPKLAKPGNETLNIEHNYRQFGNNSVSLSLNLGAIGSPTTYSVMFYTKYMHKFVEKTNTYLTPPHLDILHIGWPSSPYRMIPGDDAPIPVQINYTDLQPGVLSVRNAGNGKMSLTFDPPQITLPKLNTIIKMRIFGTENLNPGIHPITVNKTYTIPGNINISKLSTSDIFYIEIPPKGFIDPAIILLKKYAGYAAPLIVILVITIADFDSRRSKIFILDTTTGLKGP